MTTPQRDARIDALGNDERSVLILKDILREFGQDVIKIQEELGVVQERIAPPTGGTGVGVSPPPPDFAGQVLPLSIFLSWTPPDPPAHFYEIRRSSILDWTTAAFVTRTPSLTVNLAPLIAGSYYFLIKSIDALGNYSTDYSNVNLLVIPPGAPMVTATVIDNNVLLYWTVPQTSHQIDHYNIYRNSVFFGTDQRNFYTDI